MPGEDDVVRSVRAYAFEMLGAPWTIDLERDDLPDSERPGGLIEGGQSAPRRARTSIDQGPYERFMPVTLTLYPSLQQQRLAGRTARQLADALGRLVEVGLDTITLASGRPACGPFRIPLWDFAEVPLIGTPEERARPEFPVQVMWVEDSSTRAIQDPLDSKRWSVVLDMRVSWEVAGRTGPIAPTVTSMPVNGGTA
jgi:hypothetical protein